MVKRTNDAAQEESKETVGFVAEDSKGDSVPFGTRLSVESLVCYTFIRKPADISRQSRSMYVGRRMCARASTAPALRLIAQNSSVCPVEAQAAVIALRREKVASVKEADF